MTRLTAEIKDFALVWKGDEIVAYRFRMGKCEDFADMMNRFKQAIPYDERRPTPEKAWLWEVDHSQRNFNAMDSVFDNFHECYDIATRQMRLWS